MDEQAKLQDAINEQASQKSAGKVCGACLGRKLASDGSRCQSCHGLGIDPKSGKDAAGMIDLVTK